MTVTVAYWKSTTIFTHKHITSTAILQLNTGRLVAYLPQFFQHRTCGDKDKLMNAFTGDHPVQTLQVSRSTEQNQEESPSERYNRITSEACIPLIRYCSVLDTRSKTLPNESITRACHNWSKSQVKRNTISTLILSHALPSDNSHSRLFLAVFPLTNATTQS